MDQSRKSSSDNMDERIRQYAEEMMRAYRRQNPSPVPVREPAAPLIPAEPVRGEIPPPPAKRETLPERELPPDETLCRPLFPVDSPIFHKPIRPASPPKPSPPLADQPEQKPELSAHPNPGVTLRPVLPVSPAREPALSELERPAQDPPPSGRDAAFEPEEQRAYREPIREREERGERMEREEQGEEERGERNERDGRGERRENGDDFSFLPRVVEPPEDGEFFRPFSAGTDSPADEALPVDRKESAAIDDIADTSGGNDLTVGNADDDPLKYEKIDRMQAEPVLSPENRSEKSGPLSDQMPPSPPSTGIARLRVWVTTARQAIPIEGARVVVTQEDGGEQALRWVLITDRDGNAEIVELPAVPAEYSQRPGVPHPYTSYTIEISKPGYFTVKNNHVPLYGGVTAIQPVDLTPLPENMGGSGTEAPGEITYNEAGPQEL